MDWPQILGYLITGGIVTKLIDVAVQGWREQATARGKREDEQERDKREVFLWMEVAYRARRAAIQHGATETELGALPADPNRP